MPNPVTSAQNRIFATFQHLGFAPDFLRENFYGGIRFYTRS